jgi:hypothetical protein
VYQEDKWLASPRGRSAVDVCADEGEDEDEDEDVSRDWVGVDGTLYRFVVGHEDGVPAPWSAL